MEVNILEGQWVTFKEGFIFVDLHNTYTDTSGTIRENGTDSEVFIKVMNKGRLVDFSENRG